jgi:ADP-ribosylglycohydrolase
LFLLLLSLQAHKLSELRRHMFAASLPALELTEHKRIGYTYKCLGAGFWALREGEGGLQLPGRGAGGRFRAALEAVMFAGGDADTNGAVAGALLGCRLGVHRLPHTWMAFKHKAWLDPIITRSVTR